MTQVVILAGGKGTRLAEETETKPKPMVNVAGRPILWHIMNGYARYGFTEFIVCLGYRGYQIKEYFANYYLHSADVTFDLLSGEVEYHRTRSEPWKVTLVDTGLETMTGGRIKRIRDYLHDSEPFCMTYGDGVSNINFAQQLAFHHSHGRMCTMTVVPPPARFGSVQTDGARVIAFKEKVTEPGSYINGGFFIVDPRSIDLVEDDTVSWEREPLESLAAQGELVAWRHDGYWQPMDTLRDKRMLEERAAEFLTP